MKSHILIALIALGQTVLAEEPTYLSANQHQPEKFETECFIKAAVIGNMDCPSEKEYKILIETTDSELLQYFENRTGKSFEKIELNNILPFFDEFEKNNKLPVSAKYRKQFLKLVKGGSDYSFAVAFYRGILTRDYAFVLAYSMKKRSVLSFDINLRY